MNNSRVVALKNETHASRLISSANDLRQIEDYSLMPDGIWNRVAIIKSRSVEINAEDIDLEFTVPFDDNLESNEAEIIIYNLSDDTINKLFDKAPLTIEAGYKGDTGVIFKGYIVKKSTTYENSDKITTIKCRDDISKKDIVNKSYASGTKASVILKDLIDLTGLPVAMRGIRRDHVYDNAVTIDESLESAIKKYSEVCGVSTFVNKGSIWCMYIKNYNIINFTISEETGMIGSPSPYTEELTAEEYTDTINGYEVEMLLQHRISTAAGVNIKSKHVNGTYRVRSGEHIFNESECITKIKVF